MSTSRFHGFAAATIFGIALLGATSALAGDSPRSCAVEIARKQARLGRCLERGGTDDERRALCFQRYDGYAVASSCGSDDTSLPPSYFHSDARAIRCDAERRVAEHRLYDCRSGCEMVEGALDSACEVQCRSGFDRALARSGAEECPPLREPACGEAGAATESAPDCGARPRSSETVRGFVDTPGGPIEADFEVIDGYAVFEGDILVGPVAEVRERYLAVESGLSSPKAVGRRSAKYRWPGGVVPFQIDPNLPNDRRVFDAIAHWEAWTPLRFVERTNQEHFVRFSRGTVCASYVGRLRDGRQDITLSDGCSTGSTIHEIGHAIGLWHEQSRRDRDQHVEIHWSNIKKGEKHNFETYEQQDEDGIDLGDFDFGSIMLYGPYDFSKNGQPTITKLDGSVYSVNRSGLSAGDRAAADALYRQGAVYVARSNGKGEFVGTGKRWHEWFCVEGSTCAQGDVNGDGREDLVSFEHNGEVWVSLSGRSCSGIWPFLDCRDHFATLHRWHKAFCFGDEICKVADVNGDAKADVVTFTRGSRGDVYVALSTGTKFSGTGWKWHDAFSFGTEVPEVGDVNGDRKADVITFTRGGTGDVYVALSTGKAFKGTGVKWHDAFAFGSEVPRVGDVNGDRRADIVTFTRGKTGDVYVALSTGKTFSGVGVKWHDAFAFGSEIPRVADVSGDGKADIVTFTRGGIGDVFVATSTGRSFQGTGWRWHDRFCFGEELCSTADVDGDGEVDVIAYGR